MRYEHLIQINDPQQPWIDPLSRAQLWAGLMQRVLAPQRFPVGPDACEILARQEAPGGDAVVLRRQVRFGALALLDTVRLVPSQSIRFDPDPRDDMAPMALAITLEVDPAAPTESLYLRFVYESPVDDAETDGYRQQAWLENDRDMVRTIRAWIDDGEL